MRAEHSVLRAERRYSDDLLTQYYQWLQEVNKTKDQLSADDMRACHMSMLRTAGLVGELDIVKQVFDIAWDRKDATSPLAFLAVTAASKRGDYGFALSAYSRGIKAHSKDVRIHKAMLVAAFVAKQFRDVAPVMRAALKPGVLRDDEVKIMREQFRDCYEYELCGLKKNIQQNRFDVAVRGWHDLQALPTKQVYLHIAVLNELALKGAVVLFHRVYSTAVSYDQVNAELLQTVCVIAAKYNDKALAQHAITLAQSKGMVDVTFVSDLLCKHEAADQRYMVQYLLKRAFQDYPECRADIFLTSKAYEYGVPVPGVAYSHTGAGLFAVVASADVSSERMGERSDRDLIGSALVEEIGPVESPTRRM
ncbi:MAG: hypothetical protein P1U40_14060 [Coxiellaceae bacterium]|nr:hypothetical protein [Coxiellaceae bacterium]